MMIPSIAWLQHVIVREISYSQSQIARGICLWSLFDQQSLDWVRFKFLHADLNETIFAREFVRIRDQINEDLTDSLGI